MKGILFKEALFRKVVSGEKTETRRVINPPKSPNNYGLVSLLSTENSGFIFCLSVANGYENVSMKPRYKVGETVYLKEPYVISESKAYYKFNLTNSPFPYGEVLAKYIKWKNKLFMPAEHARYFIKITEVYAEKLQEITIDSIQKEGIEKGKGTYHSAWVKIWDEINGKTCSWKSNPLVWVYKFELIDVD